MLPIKLELKNFLAYRSPGAIVFEGIHLAALTGANGAGKSSLLDAITWALWGEARAKSDDDLIHQGETEMSVALDFLQEETTYRVARQKKRKGTGKLQFYALNPDGGWIDLSENSVRMTQAKINRLLRMEHDTFIASAFLQQGKADAFTSKTAAERKKVLSDILGLDRWADYEDAVKIELDKLKSEIALKEMQIREIDGELREEPRYLRDLAEATAARETTEREMEAAREALEAVRHAPARLNDARDRQGVIARRLHARSIRVESILTVLARLEIDLEERRALVAEGEQIEAGYAQLEAARKADQVLNAKLRELKTLQAAHDKAEREIERERGRLENELGRIEAEIDGQRRILTRVNADRLHERQAALDALSEKEAQRDGFRQYVSDLAADIKGLTDAREATVRAGKDTRDRLDNLSQLDLAVMETCPTCGQPLNAEHHSHLLGDLKAKREAMLAEYNRDGEQIASLTVQRADYQKLVARLDLDLRPLAELRKEIGGLEKEAQNAQAAQAAIADASGRADSLRIRLHADDFADDARARLAEIDGEIAALAYDEDSYDETQAQIREYQRYQDLHRKWTTARETLPTLENSHAERMAALHEEREQGERDGQEADAIDAEIADLAVQAQAYHLRKAEFDRLLDIDNKARERISIARQELLALENKKIKREALNGALIDSRDDHAAYTQLREAFGKHGIPTLIIEAVLPELEDAANDLLSRLSDNRMRMTFETQRESKAGGAIETLDIRVSDVLGTRLYEMFSGGEAFRINFAIRVALSQLLARRAGAHLRTLFLDEGFGTQDEDGRARLVEAIGTIQDDFDLILVITHIDELRDQFPVLLQVEKHPDGSRITLRG